MSSVTVCLFKYTKDTRDGENTVASRSGCTRQATAQITSGIEAWEKVCETISANPGKSVIVGIDEGQFIKGLSYFIKRVFETTTVTINVFISALDSKFNGEMWEEIINIIPLCNEVTKLTAICGICQAVEAQLTKRIVTSTEIELIGSDQYVAACYNCYHQEM